jgi:hypothetical protein
MRVGTGSDRRGMTYLLVLIIVGNGVGIQPRSGIVAIAT